MSFSPFKIDCKSLCVCVCVCSYCVCVHPLNKDISQAIIGTFFQCILLKMVGWVALYFKIQNPLKDISLHRKLDTQSWFLLCFTPFIRVVKSSRLPAKIAAYLVSIGQLLCLAFLYRWRFLNKISLGWPLTLTTSHLLQNFLTTLLYMILLKTDISLELTKLKIESRLNRTHLFSQNFDRKKSNSIIFQIKSKTRPH